MGEQLALVLSCMFVAIAFDIAFWLGLHAVAAR